MLLKWLSPLHGLSTCYIVCTNFLYIGIVNKTWHVCTLVQLTIATMHGIDDVFSLHHSSVIHRKMKDKKTKKNSLPHEQKYFV